MDCSLSDSSVHGILQARILEWVAIPFSRGSSLPRDQTWVSCTPGRFFTIWATREALRPRDLTSKEWVTYEATFPEQHLCAEDWDWSNSRQGLRTPAPTHQMGHWSLKGNAEGLSLKHATILPRNTTQTGIRPRSFSSVFGHLSMWITILGFLFHSYPHIQYSICLLLKNKWLSGPGVHFSLPSCLCVTFLPAVTTTTCSSANYLF